MKIVKFSDGLYAIRKGFKLFGYKYRDLSSINWWDINHPEYFKGDKEQIETLFNALTDRGKIVK